MKPALVIATLCAWCGTNPATTTVHATETCRTCASNKDERITKALERWKRGRDGRS